MRIVSNILLRYEKRDYLKVVLVLALCILWIQARERAYTVSQGYIIQTVRESVGESFLLSNIQLGSAFGYSHIWWVDLRAVYQAIDNPQDSSGWDRAITVNVITGEVMEAWFEQ